MAYQAKHRDPLFDSAMQAAIEKRGREMIGIGLIAAGLMVALMLGSYVPDDPSWLSATDAPAQNILGRFGASIAGPLFIIVGHAAWALPVILGAWGIRFARHLGSERALSRLVFAPIAVALAAIYGAMLTPGGDWVHSFGLGGLFGDTVLGALFNILPIGAGLGVRLLAIPFGLGALAMLVFALGATRAELRLFGRFLLVGVIMLYAGAMKLMGKGAQGSLSLAQAIRARRAARREAAAEAELLAEAAAPGARIAIIRVAPASVNQVLTSCDFGTSPLSCASFKRFCVGSSVFSESSVSSAIVTDHPTINLPSDSWKCSR